MVRFSGLMFLMVAVGDVTYWSINKYYITANRLVELEKSNICRMK